MKSIKLLSYFLKFKTRLFYSVSPPYPYEVTIINKRKLCHQLTLLCQLVDTVERLCAFIIACHLSNYNFKNRRRLLRTAQINDFSSHCKDSVEMDCFLHQWIHSHTVTFPLPQLAFGETFVRFIANIKIAFLSRLP